MIRISYVILIFINIFYLSPQILSQSIRTKAILIYPIGEKNNIGEPGQIVFITKNDSAKRSITLEVDHKLYPNTSNYVVIPYDSVFSVSKAYLMINDGHEWSGNEYEKLRNSFYLAKNICANFPNHHLFEEMLYLCCIYSEKFENDMYSLYPVTITYVKKYLTLFKNGKYFDEVEWQLLRLQNVIQDFEGFASQPLSLIKAFEPYLKSHPKSKCVDKIKMELADLYRETFECIEYSFEENEPDGFTKENGKSFLDKSIAYYTSLLKSNDLLLREKARVSLYNIKNNRRANVGTNDW